MWCAWSQWGGDQTGRRTTPPCINSKAGLTAVPLSGYGKPYTPPKGKVDPQADKGAPVEQVEKMDAAAFFGLFAKLAKANPPHANDYPILAQMARLGIVPGETFDLGKVSPEARAALEAAPAAGLKKIQADFLASGVATNGWRTNLATIGTYGTAYLKRAGVAFAGLGANCIEDAIYPSALTAADGEAFR